MAHPDDLKRAEVRKEQAAMVRTIGERMRHARELCNMSQSAAAKRLGYSNPSKLSKVEAATDTNSVPLWLIPRAARAYEVSVDFLFGFTDDWEVGARMTQEREVSAWLGDALARMRTRDLEALAQLNCRLEVLREAVATLTGSSDDVNSALARFIELNPDFEDMRGSNRLAQAVDRSHGAAVHSRAKMARFKMECKLAAGSTHQLSLSLTGGVD